MKRFWISLVVMMIAVLPIAGCGGSDDGAAKGTLALETSTTQAPAAVTTTVQDPATETSTTLAPASATSTSQAPSTDDWTTVATLQSTDSPWQGMEGILLSEPFTVSGTARLVLDMPDAGQLDGVIVAIIPDDKATDVGALLGAIQEGVVVTLPAAKPTKEVSGLDGTYVLVNSVPASAPWSLELQTRP